VLEDAYHFLKIRGLDGNHATAVFPVCLDLQKVLPKPSALLKARQMDLKLSNHALETYSSNGSKPDNGTTMPHFILLSSADKPGLERMLDVYTSYFRSSCGSLEASEVETYLKCLQYTLLERRSVLSWKRFAIVGTVEDLKDLSSKLSAPIRPTQGARLGYVFTGQGAQYPAMGIGLLAYATFRNSIARSEECLRDLGCPWLLRGTSAQIAFRSYLQSLSPNLLSPLSNYAD
jgi:acyl transferase domain-containing protein